MKRWLQRQIREQVWRYVEKQIGDIATILRGLWADVPPSNFREFRDDLEHALKQVLLHGRPAEG